MLLTRRNLLLACASLPLATPLLAHAQADRRIHVLKDPNCECCTGWVSHLQGAGFKVTMEEIHAGLLAVRKGELGVPIDLQSCHTGEAGGYVLEGHVPAADIERLLTECPDALGLAVPGMPYGSPGMGPETERDAYEVILFRRDGTTQVWTAYEEA